MKMIKYILLLGFISAAFWCRSQDVVPVITTDIISNTNVTIKSSEKLNDKPSIADTVKKITDLKYSITSKSTPTSYFPGTIVPAKMVNEPLAKLYHCLIKAGMGNYTMPYGEIFINNLRSKEYAYGFRYKHLSSTATLANSGFSGFSDNEIYLNGKKFLKRHTLSGDFNYLRNVNRFYGHDVPATVDKNFTKQAWNTFEAKVNLLSHFTDSSKLNHDINLNFYNLSDRYKLNESNVTGNGLVKTYIMGERFNVFASVDYFNHKMSNDTVNNIIGKVYPYFEAGGKKWSADIGPAIAIDKFSDSSAKFRGYLRFHVHYNVYENIIVPYAGTGGDLEKNSFRSLMQQNPFIQSNLQLKNTNTRFEGYVGLRGALSAKTNYDAKVTYQKVSDMALFNVDYSDPLKNRFKMIYDDADVLKVSGQLKYSHKEKINVIAGGNYYHYKMANDKYAWHRPSFDIKLSSTYNIKSKIITRADFFFIGNQWAQQVTTDAAGVSVTNPTLLKGVADINLGFEYRYSKFLSGFVNFNNVANFRYYRWDRYPTQRFNFMLGLTFIPF